MYDKAISPSGLKLFKSCPHRWHDTYILGHREPSGAAAERGIYLHKLLERFFLGETLYPVAEATLVPWRAYMEALRAKRLEPEFEFGATRDGGVVSFDSDAAYARGKIDGRLYRDRILDIYDWKSGRVYPEHEAQGIFYGAFDRLDPSEYDEIRTHFVYLDQPLRVDTRRYSPADMGRHREELVRVIDGIRAAEEYPATPSEDGCKWCPLSWRRGGTCTRAY